MADVKEVLKNIKFKVDFSKYKFKHAKQAGVVAFESGIKQLIKSGAFKDCEPKLTKDGDCLSLALVIDERLVDKYKRELSLVAKPYSLFGVNSSFEVIA